MYSEQCQVCKDLPGWGVPGTLMHRHVCPVLEPFRKVHQPGWLELFIRCNQHSLTSAQHLALTRGLVAGPELPTRDSSLYDTFIWEKQTYTIPFDATVCTDGSLLDGKLPKEGQALGWSFAVLYEGELVCAAYGVPPKWVDSIQGAELWAVHMALIHVHFPSKLFTDCESVSKGSRQSTEWASSSKRRYARIWSPLALQIEGRSEVIFWIPAHTPESSIGHRRCSDGSILSEDLWSANQIVDFLAKYAAEGARVTASSRVWFLKYDPKVRELVRYLGLLTYEANMCCLPNGEFIRDSDASELHRRVRVKELGKASPNNTRKHVSKSKTSISSTSRGNWRGLYSAKPKGSVSSGTSFKVQAKAIDERQRLAFFEWWREARETTLKPRPDTMPTAKQRLEALALRIAAKNAAPSG